MMVKGHAYKEISAELGLSDSTVHTHIERIYTKLHVRSRSPRWRSISGREESLCGPDTNEKYKEYGRLRPMQGSMGLAVDGDVHAPYEGLALGKRCIGQITPFAQWISP
jgi:hypothetical protein